MSDDLDALRIGEKVSEGRFRIDQKRALEKLRTSRLADPTHWVLEVLRAAQASGAKQVEVRADSSLVSIAFDGRPFPAAVMKDLLAQALGGDDGADPRHRLFALGIAGAMGAGLKHLRVQSGKVRLDIDPSGDVIVEPVASQQLDEADVERTTVEGQKKLSLKVAAQWLTGKSGEVGLLLNACSAYGPELRVNGRANFRATLPEKRHDKDGVRVYAEAVEHSATSLVRVEVYGVYVAMRTWSLPGVQLNATVQCDRLRRNASGSDLVDDDPALLAVQDICRSISLRELEKLAKEPSPLLRKRIATRLLDEEKIDPQAQRIMRDAPLFPGPSGERYSINALRAAVVSGQPLRMASESYPKGSYPQPTVLVDDDTREWDALLPPGKREDVQALVRRNLRAAENKASWEAQAPEAVALPDRKWLATADVRAPKLTGAVGIEERGQGAFVRLLAGGRFVQQGEVPLLAPLRLRAVVDYGGTIADKVWAELPNAKLWSMVVDEVASAASRAICSALSAPELSPGARVHARDLLTRLSASGRESIPQQLLQAPLFECIGGEPVSFGQLDKSSEWRFVAYACKYPTLDGKRVLVLNPLEQQVLKPLCNGRLKDVTDQLNSELKVRRRLEGPRQEPVVSNTLVRVSFEGEGMHGELGIAEDSGVQLRLELYREGFHLESTHLSASFGPVAAAVEFPTLSPSSNWSKAVRDAAFDAVVAQVKAAVPKLTAPLLEAYPRFSAMPLAARRWLVGRVQRDLSPEVLSAELLDGADGPISLAELKAKAGNGPIWILPGSAAQLMGLAAVSGGADVAALVKAGIGVEPKDGMPEVERALAHARFYAQAPYASETERLPLHVDFTLGPLLCEAGFDTALARSAVVRVIFEQRLWHQENLPAGLPLKVEARPSEADPSAPPDPSLKALLNEAVKAAQVKIIELALESQSDAASRRALFFAIGAHAEDWLPDASAKRVYDAPLFECSDGVWRSARALLEQKHVQFITERLEGTFRSGVPLVLALEPDVAAGLARFERSDATDALKLELKTRSERQKLEPVERIAFDGRALVTRVLRGRVEGDVVIAPHAQGRLTLFFERRPLCVVDGALPLPLAATVNCDTVTPTPSGDGVERDAAYRSLVSALLNEADALGVELAQRWSDLRTQPGALEAALRLCAQLGRKKATKRHALLDAELLATTDNQPLTVRALLDEKAKRKPVRIAEREGTLLRGEWVWRADVLQRQWLEPLQLETLDVSGELERAQRVRARPKVETLKAPLESPRRERIDASGIDASGIEGEVALPDRPTGKLFVELYQQRSLLERYESEHACGGAAAVNFDKLQPNPSWTKAARNAQFRAVLEQVNAALSRLLARRVMARDEAWRAWAETAVHHDQGAVKDVLPGLELFETLSGKPVSVGAVLAEFSRLRRVAVASGELDAGDQLVLLGSPKTHELLEALGVTSKDVSDELRRKGELEQARRARRLEALTWPGDALVRLPLQLRGMSGELALPAREVDVEVTLAKQGVRVSALPSGLAPGVTGVVDIEALLVDESWTEARLSVEQRSALAEQVDALLSQLSHAVPTFSKDRRIEARRHVLAWLLHSGVHAAAHVDRLTGAAAALAKAPVFETLEGEWVSLTVLCEEVRRRGRVAVFAWSLFRPDTEGALGLKAHALDDAWLEVLEKVLGSGALERVKNASQWREELREEDPPKGSPELWGLSRLRRDVRLLRAGALGELSPEDVEDVRLKALGGETPVHYDAGRKVVLLDSEHASVKRALAESKLRRERLYVLLAAMYGAINRALERITDQHEEELSLALAAHLAANPQLLEPGDESS